VYSVFSKPRSLIVACRSRCPKIGCAFWNRLVEMPTDIGPRTNRLTSSIQDTMDSVFCLAVLVTGLFGPQ